MTKLISIFNHKGGVSKTTSTFHIAWKLSTLGKKVLMIDADPQCNLTVLSLGEEGYKNFHNEHPERNVKIGLRPAFTAQTSAIKAVECVEVKENLYLMPGDLELGEYEVQLAFSFLNSFGIMKNLPGAFYYLAKETAEKYGIDYVLIDMNPSLSALNQDIILTTDYFIIPTSPDYFSAMAIESLSKVIPQWESWAVTARNTFQDSVYPMPLSSPKFLGYTINDFSIRKGKPVAAFQEMISSIENGINDKLVPKLEVYNLMLESTKYEGSYCLGNIHDFGSLIAKSQEYGIPVFQLSDEQIGLTGIVLERTKESIVSFDKAFQDISEKIIRITI